jgi:hypothetical protein
VATTVLSVDWFFEERSLAEWKHGNKTSCAATANRENRDMATFTSKGRIKRAE